MDFNKKEMPIQGFAGFGGGATSAAFRSSASGAKYVDEVFYSTPYTGNDGAQSFSTGVNMSKGGLLWVKRSSATENHYLFDSERKSGSNFKSIYSDLNSAEDTRAWGISFDNNGHSFDDNDNAINNDGDEYVNWTFRKKEKFFDVQTYTGNQTNGRQISHNLGCVPGCIMVKRTDGGTDDWMVYHRGNADTSNAGNYWLTLNTNAAKGNSDRFYDLEPTATYFTVSDHETVNTNSYEYVAYLFAGGASTAATARSVHFDGTTDELSVSDSADFDYGSGDFTLELWINPNVYDHSQKLIHAHTSGSNYGPCNLFFDNSGTNMLTLYASSNNSSFDVASGTEFGIIPAKSWTHIAVAREGNNIRMFKNGINVATISHSGSMMNPTGTFDIGARNGLYHFNGKVSNFRVVKGTAVYTTSFRPPTEPLTNITNTVLLCCNNSSSTTGSTVVPSGSSITANGDPTVSTDNPFDDPDGFAFGEDEDQQIITTGSYIGDGQTVGPEIYLGWEPQWIMLKRTDSTGDWGIFDTMRGIPTGGSDYYLKPNSNNDSATGGQTIELTPTGFKLRYGQTISNLDGAEMVYVAIRRPDALVGKPAEAGTDAFAIDLDGTNSGNPSWVSGFPVDMSFIKDRSGTTYDWFLSSRLTQGNYISMMSNAVQASNAVYMYDYINGWGNYSSASSITSWMWKRGKGYTTTVYRGGGTAGQVVNHDLNAVPKMIWVKRITGSVEGWSVYHVGLNGGTNPSHYNLKLDETAVEEDTESRWYDTAPTSTYFQIGDSSRVNGSDDLFMAMLFTDVTGFSKCGYYDGQNSEKTITTGFQPRFVIIKCTTNAEDWYLLDTERGWGSGNDKVLRPNLENAQYNNDLGAPTSTGFTLTVDNGSNASGRKYVYYAHA